MRGGSVCGFYASLIHSDDVFFYSETFGLYHVDFSDPDRRRTAKKSAEVFSEIVKRNEIPARFLTEKSSL